MARIAQGRSTYRAVGGDGSVDQVNRPLPGFSWKEKPTADDLNAVRDHPCLRGYGIVPASIGYSVLDVDEKTDNGIEALRKEHPSAVSMPSLGGEGLH